jgi:hypothetical protein
MQPFAIRIEQLNPLHALAVHTLSCGLIVPFL